MLERKLIGASLMAPALLLGGAAVASAQTPMPDDVVAPDTMRPAGEATEGALADAEGESKISGSIGVDVASHFVSYGADVWGGGDDIFGDDSTVFVWSEYAFDLEPFTLTLGIWSDLNDNPEDDPATVTDEGDSPLGGPIQEIDVYAGIGYSIGDLSLGVTYQEWYYADDTERIVDVSAAYDDTGLIFEDFALKPSVLWHFRIDGNNAQEEGSIVVLSIEPSFTLLESEDYPLTLAIPMGVGFLLEDDFHGGDESGFGYAYVGGTLSVPLGFIPDGYGEWTASGNLTYYITNDEAIPGNPEEDFLAAMVSLSLGF